MIGRRFCWRQPDRRAIVTGGCVSCGLRSQVQSAAYGKLIGRSIPLVPKPFSYTRRFWQRVCMPAQAPLHRHTCSYGRNGKFFGRAQTGAAKVTYTSRKVTVLRCKVTVLHPKVVPDPSTVSDVSGALPPSARRAIHVHSFAAERDCGERGGFPYLGSHEAQVSLRPIHGPTHGPIHGMTA